MVTIIPEKQGGRAGIFGNVGFETVVERNNWIRKAAERGINYFVVYRDVQATFAVQYAICSWSTTDARMSAMTRTYGNGWNRELASAFQGPPDFHAHFANISVQ